jgi:DNA-directed RNA polymerase specialized sigma24 family protein
VAEEYGRLVGMLGDAQLRAIAQMKMEGYGESEIAERVGCVERAVRRKLQLIRNRWAKEVVP